MSCYVHTFVWLYHSKSEEYCTFKETAIRIISLKKIKNCSKPFYIQNLAKSPEDIYKEYACSTYDFSCINYWLHVHKLSVCFFSL